MSRNKPLKSLNIVGNTAEGIKTLHFLPDCNAVAIPDQRDCDKRFFCEVYIRPEFTGLFKVILAEEEILEKENVYQGSNRFFVYLEWRSLSQMFVDLGVEIIDERRRL
ncbi:MAG: hypothetical protein HY044_00285 [Candidatus Woesebacteria bacterium]|nr:MAG: hypothetical protein HY044_00285 [Candidatus Woesebacteria bacterium]